MTKDKAIELLDNLIGMVEDNHGNDYDKAIHMAIDALKADVRENVKGVWVHDSTKGTICSVCGSIRRDNREIRNDLRYI